ncbi:hypothetical protein DL93DRAFT_857413 [Clavulina sp. PMI_390]|nr:hypothetical protein DL93DRAFT_857413 [Clavulina sp. PMI_390]
MNCFYNVFRMHYIFFPPPRPPMPAEQPRNDANVDGGYQLQELWRTRWKRIGGVENISGIASATSQSPRMSAERSSHVVDDKYPLLHHHRNARSALQHSGVTVLVHHQPRRHPTPTTPRASQTPARRPYSQVYDHRGAQHHLLHHDSSLRDAERRFAIAVLHSWQHNDAQRPRPCNDLERA